MGLALEVSRVTWGFDSQEAPFLRITDLTLAPGQVLAVTGPSGAGKSTLLSLLAGFEAPAAGTIRWGDHDLGTASETSRDRWRRDHVGLVFQDFQLVPELTAVENVLLPLTFSRFTVGRSERAKASALLEELGVTRVTARASTLSRGEMQRTALARALLSRPPVVLADEPTASLDADNEAAVTNLLIDCARRHGATVVVATHQPRLIEKADRQVRLDHGALEVV